MAADQGFRCCRRVSVTQSLDRVKPHTRYASIATEFGAIQRALTAVAWTVSIAFIADALHRQVWASGPPIWAADSQGPSLS